MSKLELLNYNFREQRFDIQINCSIKTGYIILKDIDLETTIYKMKVWDVNPGYGFFFIPTPKHGFDFSRDDFGGFLFELIDDGVVIDKQFLRLRDTDMYKYKQSFLNDFYHPVFVNYREFFQWDRYKEFNLENCEKVIDAGGSIGLFTKYMLNKGSKQVYTVECDDRSLKALRSNFSYYDNVVIVPKALYSSEGEMALYWKDDNPLVNSLDINGSEFKEYENPDYKMVPTTTLEKLVEETGWENIDLLKIDIEGSEWEVINSTPNYIFEITEKFLLEYHWPNGRLQDVINRMNILGFKYKFEFGCDVDDENGTILFYR